MKNLSFFVFLFVCLFVFQEVLADQAVIPGTGGKSRRNSTKKKTSVVYNKQVESIKN